MNKLPEIIYKYRNWKEDFHKNVLLKNELFLSYPKDFNDPFDCKIAKKHHLLDTKEKIEIYIENLFEKHRNTIQRENIDAEYYKNKFREKLKDLNTFQKEHEEIEFSTMDDYLGVLSMSGRWDSILMWSHYADNHKGFCIGFNEFKLRNFKYFGAGGNVSYLENFPILDPNDNSLNGMAKRFSQTHNKAKEWEYEKEYRLIQIFRPDQNQQRLVCFPDNFIEEIILGVNINEKDKKEITQIALKKNIKIYQAEKIPYKFKLKKVLVHLH